MSEAAGATPPPVTPAPVTPALGAAGRLADGEWHRLHPATPLLRGGFALVAILGVILVNLRDVWIDLIIGGPDGGPPDPLVWILEHDYALPVLAAIAAGKHVVTANKALLAVHGSEIFAAAREKGVVVAFEGAVAGGIPIIKALREGLSANRIEWVAGIINGTTNFILSEMRSKGLDFDTVLKEAQRLGYAEADPTFDIEGVDAAHKATIMSAIAFGIPVQFDKAHVEGITKLQAADIRYAEQLGYRIKLLGITKRREKGIELRVHPTLIPATRLIANVEGAMNAVVVHGDAVGTTLYYGKGAGAEPTASAVIADLVDITRLHTADPDHRVPSLAFQPGAMQDTPILPMAEVVTSFYLRLVVADKAGVLARITGILAEHGISIDAVLQRESDEGEAQTDLIILTHDTLEGEMDKALAQMQALPTVLAPIVRIRKEELK